MKFFKKLLLLSLTALVCLGFGIVTACDDGNSSSPTSSSSASSSVTTTPQTYLYKIRTQSVGGFGLRNVSVDLYNGETLVASKTTSAEGNAFFTEDDVTAGEYDIRLSNLPDGWSLKDNLNYKTSAFGGDVTISLTPALISEEAPSSKRYRLGDVMHDFTVTTSDGNSYTLSQVLEEKRMVLLNFWYDGCGPCQAEFPVMQNAYVEQKAKADLVSILAVSIHSGDNVSAYKADMGLTFDMAEYNDLVSQFTIGAVLVSIVIDRYGVISYWHLGSMTAKSDFTGLFDKFIGDNYIQTVLDSNYNGSGNTGTEEEEQVLPNVSAPSFSDVQNVLDATNDLNATYSWNEDKYAWPWTVHVDTSGTKYLRASNSNVHHSFAILQMNFNAKAGDALTFDGRISTEEYDYLYVIVNNKEIHALSGIEYEEWKDYVAYVFTEDGNYDLSFVYLKDYSMSSGEDEVWIKNLQIVPATDLNTESVDVNIIRDAATGYNDPSTEEGKTATTAYKHYVKVAFGVDEYYHVDVNGDGEVDMDSEPVLFANLLGVNLWNAYDISQLAINDYLIVDGMNMVDVIRDYAWIASNSDNGYVPVTHSLQKVLQMITTQEIAFELSNKPYHENEWLEMCVYYDHYGKTPLMQDPTLGVSFDSAIELVETKTGDDVNHLDINRYLVPRGMKHKFTPEKSGVYHFYSKFPEEVLGTGAQYDPEAWLVDTDRSTFLVHSEDTLKGAYDNNLDNFSIYAYLEEDKTYYLIIAFFLDSFGKLDVAIEYKGESYTYLENCAKGPYSFNLVTNNYYVPDAIKTILGQDGYLHTVTLDEDYNEVASNNKVYLDLVNTTYMFTRDALADKIEQADSYKVEKRLFYLDGKDYSEIMQKYLHQAKLQNGEYYGLLAINEEVLEILQLFTKRHDGFNGIKNSWQLMCYYEKTVDANSRY